MESCTDINVLLRMNFHLLQGTSNSLNLIQMPLYNLHEQMRPSVKSSYFFRVIIVILTTYLYRVTHNIKNLLWQCAEDELRSQ